jgi:ferredoxin-NADP reductase
VTDGSPPVSPTVSPGPLVWRTVEVVETRRETGRARTLRLRVSDWPGHDPGQHVDVRLTSDDGYQAQRSYSIASAPEEPLALTIERMVDGEVSPYLVDELRAGDTFEIRGPIGGYFRWRTQDGGPLLLVGGGSGVVPLMSMLRHRAARQSSVPARLVYSARTLDDALYLPELDSLRVARDPAEITITLTRSAPSGWTGAVGRIDKSLLDRPAFAPDRRPYIYVCGPTSFVERAAELLVEVGHAPERIRTERFGPSA